MKKIFSNFFKAVPVLFLCLTMAVTLPCCGGSDDDEPEDPNENTGGGNGESISVAQLAGIYAESEAYEFCEATISQLEKQKAPSEVFYDLDSFVSGFELNADGTSTNYCWEIRAFKQDPILRSISTSDGTIYWTRIEKTRGSYFSVEKGKLVTDDRGECKLVGKYLQIGSTLYVKVK